MGQERDWGRGADLELDWRGRTPPAKQGTGESGAAEHPSAAGPAGHGMPGDPHHMSPELQGALQPLLEGPAIRIRQLVELSKVLLGWDARNQYEVCGLDSRPIGYVGEVGEGVAAALLRNFWAFRTVRLELMTLSGILAMSISRPWTLFFPRILVQAWDGRLMGTIQGRFRLFGRRLDLLTPGGTGLATIKGPPFHPWTFHVEKQGVRVATIRKRWSNLTQELLTDADNFGVEFDPSLADGRLRQLVLAATVAIDLVYFERKPSH